MKKIIIFFIFICAFHCPILAQIIQVQVLSEKNQPLPYSQVYQKKSGLSVLTDVNGMADISQFDKNESLEIRQLGYNKKKISFTELAALNFKVVLILADQMMNELVVSGNRWEQQSKEIPAKIESIKAAEINFQNPQTAADLLQLANHVYIQKSQMGGGSPMIRGFATNRLLLVVDGVRMNNAIFRSGNIQNVISIDAQNIEETEVLFGPGSVLYGSDAIGGVMDFHTLSPHFNEEFKVEGLVNTRFSSANQEKSGHADVQLSWKKWASISSFSYSNYSDLKMGKNGPQEYLRDSFQTTLNGIDTTLINPEPELQKRTAYSQFNMMQKIAYQPNKSNTIQYAFHYGKSSDIPRYDRLTEKSNDQYKNAEWYYGPQIWQMQQLKWTLTDTTQLYDHLKLNLSYQYFEESRNDRRYQSNILRNRTERVNAYTATIDFDKKLSKKTDLFYGAEYWLNKVNSKGIEKNINNENSSPIQSRYPNNSIMDSYGLYTLLKWKISPKLITNTALRFSHFRIDAPLNSDFFNFPIERAELSKGALNGSIGAVYLPLPTVKLYSNLSTGFRAPNIDDVGKVFDSEPGIVIVPNADLAPEYAYSADLGTTFSIQNQLKFDVSIFYTYLNNALARRDFHLNGEDSIMYDGTLSKVEAIQNIGFAEVYGVQVSAVWNLNPFKISGAYNWQQGIETDDNELTNVPLRHVPPSYGNAHVTYSNNGFKFDLYTLFNGEISFAQLAPSERNKAYIYATDDRGNPYSPSWITLNLKSEYRWKNGLSAQFGVENITNKLYRPYSSGISAVGRNFIIGMNWSF
ncbi:TonB-dependent receptor [Marivirga sp. S37H4]|uniref:TonB-dependent receptor n=1 Tax=Marivirga aurantiaca TaxID=2802615 RepID=A0A934X1Y8_9BACT|nr:TonB-dependent receptor [Marivirga aurantiaca]MBK6266821.1 TonB-dependent receptor [Marivirga aurantiaca]